jgi:hypothetical protein
LREEVGDCLDSLGDLQQPQREHRLLLERRRTIRKDHAMGDKGGKKDKDKSKKQKAMKQEQVIKGKQDRNRPK